MTIKCECGGDLREVELEMFDFSDYAGLPVMLARAPGMRCDKCDWSTLSGATMSLVMDTLCQRFLEKEELLSGDEARFLRKHLRFTQEQLAGKLGVSRVTLADWERGERPISRGNDLLLRAVAIGTLAAAPRGRGKLKFTSLRKALGAVHPSSPTPELTTDAERETAERVRLFKTLRSKLARMRETAGTIRFNRECSGDDRPACPLPPSVLVIDEFLQGQGRSPTGTRRRH